jgi:hypothetical protein
VSLTSIYTLIKHYFSHDVAYFLHLAVNSCHLYPQYAADSVELSDESVETGSCSVGR